jgi:hypothetical protein
VASWKKVIVSGSTAEFKHISASGNIVPVANDGSSLGTETRQFSDLFLGEGGVINFDGGDFTATQTNNLLVLTGGNTRVDRLEIDGANNYIDVSTDLKIISSANISLEPTSDILIGDNKISGSAVSTGSFGRLEVTADTISIGGTEIDQTVADNITNLDQGVSTTDKPLFGAVTSSTHVVGNIIEVIEVTVVDDGGNHYAFEGATTPNLVVSEGKIYRFDQSDSSNDTHPFAFSLEEDGSSYTTGVTTSGTPGTSGAYTQIQVTKATANRLFYKCTAHSGMGNQGNILKNDLGAFGGNISGSHDTTGSFGTVRVGDGAQGLGIGDAQDLKIYHDGSNSYIQDDGTGTIFYRSGTQTLQNAAGSKTMAVFNGANSVDLHYNNTKKFETTNAGITVTGEVRTSAGTTITGSLYVSGSAGGNEGAISASGDIVADGDIIAYNASDNRLKDNVKVIEGALDKIDGINGYEFDWNDKSPGWAQQRGHDVGVLAQEIQKIHPEVVAERKNGYLGVDYKRLVPLLIQSVKELRSEVEELKKKV